ncbi:MAG: aldehyde dehydrogenase (NADP(+)) [Cyclobacteriaceae bacterium]|nr:aldehyde dehydrogenase (NADP(+)) [Flammeovirgaceae bacterium]
MEYIDTTLPEINAAVLRSQEAFMSYKNSDRKKKAMFLRAIADEIEALGNELVNTAMSETYLPEARIVGERGRTTGHCRMFADLVEEGSWVEARIDTALPDRAPAPKPDIRKMLVPVGPIVVFGAANFPLAYSTAGGDTISALAAGCTVIVKAHPAHAATSTLVAKAIDRAAKKTGIGEHVFQHVHGKSFEVGQALVEHPLTKGVGFTGSLAGGKVLYDLAQRRPEPIPVFAEMSSINPVILLPDSLSQQAEKTAEMLASSITLGVGQFCTNPGLILAIDNPSLEKFIAVLSARIEVSAVGTMLHEGIAANYVAKLKQSLAQRGVKLEGKSSAGSENRAGMPAVASVSATDFLSNELLTEEVFGPYSLIVKCKDQNELHRVINHLKGQLTSSVVGVEDELAQNADLLQSLQEKAGRLIINGVPTGVEVCPSMQHGGPFPSTTDSRFTSVGVDAIKRFVRPVSFQNFPQSLLPVELKDENPMNIWRLYNNEWRK